VISGYRRNVEHICALLGYHTAYSGNSLLTFRESLSVPSAGIKKSRFLDPWRWDRQFFPKLRWGVTILRSV